jgi:miniconductance mechanosensitive channel
MAWLADRPDIIKDMYIVVRTLKPTPSGIPEIYCFTSSVLWMEYENTQSAIFEYHRCRRSILAPLISASGWS